MKLDDDYLQILRRAWSIKFIVVACIASGCEVALPILQPMIPVPTGTFAAISVAATVAGFVSRLIVQKEFDHFGE